jgi:hypothetical protein
LVGFREATPHISVGKRKIRVFIKVWGTALNTIFALLLVIGGTVTVELGELITLNGFSEEPSEMVIIKKLVGNHVKYLTEHLPDVSRLELTQRGNGSKVTIHGSLKWDEKDVEAEVTDSNLFFALDGCLKQLQKDAKKA